jgi:histidinol dehydrogenase
MKILMHPAANELEMALRRPVRKLKSIRKTVKPILKSVRQKGDIALKKYALEYDHVALDSLLVEESEFDGVETQIGAQLKSAIDLAMANIEKFHRAQIQPPLEVETMPGVTCWRRSVPIEKVGLYIPGGTAPLFSSVLMLAIPAKIAGCSELVLCTPPGQNGKIHPAILYTAKLVGIDTVVKAGGAQAIAALAYGTESVPQVYKIFGPGNQYVTAAKQLVAEKGVAIDLPAGPSELAVYADKTAIPDFVAIDLLSQAEHGSDSQVVLITEKESVAQAINKRIEKHLATLPRKKMAAAALEASVCIVVDSETKALEVINQYAPEHLILSVKNAHEIVGRIRNAGSIFLGNYTPESVGDYASGTNHTLPTNGAALAHSGVSLDSFVKKITYQKLTKSGIRNIGPAVEDMAEAEGLAAHKRAVSLRLKYLRQNNGNQ